MVTFRCLSLRRRDSLPSEAIRFFSSLSEDLILERALEVITKSIQLAVGLTLSDVIIST